MVLNALDQFVNPFERSCKHSLLLFDIPNIFDVVSLWTGVCMNANLHELLTAQSYRPFYRPTPISIKVLCKTIPSY